MSIKSNGYEGILFTTKYCTCKVKDKSMWVRLTELSGKNNRCLIRCNKCLNQWYGSGKYTVNIKKEYINKKLY